MTKHTYGLQEAFNELDSMWEDEKTEKITKLNESLRTKLQERKLREAMVEAIDEMINEEPAEEISVEEIEQGEVTADDKESAEEVEEFDIEAFKEKVNALLQLDEEGEVIESEFNDAINAVLGLFEVEEPEEEAKESSEEEVEEGLKKSEEILNDEDDFNAEEYEAAANEFIAKIAEMSPEEAKEYYYNDYKFDKHAPEDEVEQKIADALLSKINSVEECLKEETEICPECDKNPCECEDKVCPECGKEICECNK